MFMLVPQTSISIYPQEYGILYPLDDEPDLYKLAGQVRLQNIGIEQ